MDLEKWYILRHFDAKNHISCVFNPDEGVRNSYHTRDLDVFQPRLRFSSTKETISGSAGTGKLPHNCPLVQRIYCKEQTKVLRKKVINSAEFSMCKDKHISGQVIKLAAPLANIEEHFTLIKSANIFCTCFTHHYIITNILAGHIVLCIKKEKL